MIITYIGGGNMASALIGGLAGADDAPEIRVVDPSEAVRARLAADFGVATFDAPGAAVPGADVIVLAVKPQVLPGVLQDLAPHVEPGQCVISVVAGATLATLRGSLGGDRQDLALVRTMPNTPALLGLGITGLHAGADCGPEQRQAAEAIMAAAGETVWVDDEALMDVVTAVSGSGPAYFYLLTEALANAGERLGLARDTAQRLAVHTAHGAGAMLLRDGADPVTLRRRVTSPGGTTQAAIEALEAGDLRGLVDQAVTAATQRGRELSGEGDATGADA